MDDVLLKLQGPGGHSKHSCGQLRSGLDRGLVMVRCGGFHSHGGTPNHRKTLGKPPKWLVYKGKSHSNGWWLGPDLWKPPCSEFTEVVIEPKYSVLFFFCGDFMNTSCELIWDNLIWLARIVFFSNQKLVVQASNIGTQPSNMWL